MTIARLKQLFTTIAFLLLLPSLASWAEETKKDLEKATVPESLQSPRATIATFIHSMNDINHIYQLPGNVFVINSQIDENSRLYVTFYVYYSFPLLFRCSS